MNQSLAPTGIILSHTTLSGHQPLVLYKYSNLSALSKPPLIRDKTIHFIASQEEFRDSLALASGRISLKKTADSY